MSDDPETRTPDEIREEIKQTRDELGDTVEALGAKTDVKGQARAKVEEIKGNVQTRISDLGSKAPGATSTSAGSGGQQVSQQVMAKVRENPPAAVGVALLLGFLIGRRRGR